MVDSLFIGFDKSSGDIPVLTVGRLHKKNHQVDILNVFRDDEATELYEKLTKPSTLNTK